MAFLKMYDGKNRVVFKSEDSATQAASALFVDASSLLYAQFTLTLIGTGVATTGLNVGDRLETASNAKAFVVVSITNATTIIVAQDRLNSGVISAAPANSDDFVFLNGNAVTAGVWLLHGSTAVASPVDALAHKLSVSKLWWTINDTTAPSDSSLILDWEASSDLIFMRMQGGGDWELTNHGIALKNTAGSGVNGDINLTTTGTGTINHTLIIECKKELNFGTTVSTNLQQ